jgi:hypothetical protein
MLSDKAAKLRADIMGSYDFTEAEQAVLDKGLEALDTADKAQAVLDAGDLFIENRLHELVPHPAVRVAKDSRAQFFAAFKQLGLADPYGGASGHGRGAQKGRTG